MQKKNRIIKKTFVFLLTVFSVLFVSCETKLSVTAFDDASAKIDFRSSLGDVIYNTIISVAASGDPSAFGKALFEKKEIEDALNGSDLIESEVEIPSNDGVEVSGKILSPDKQRSVSDVGGLKVANFVNCGTNTLTLIISPSLIQKLIVSMPEEAQALADLLMAPVITEEMMTGSDYLDLISVIYGYELRKDLETSSVRVELSVPEGKSIKKTSLSDAKNVKTTSSKVGFSIPVAELLTLGEAKTFSITW